MDQLIDNGVVIWRVYSPNPLKTGNIIYGDMLAPQIHNLYVISMRIGDFLVSGLAIPYTKSKCVEIKIEAFQFLKWVGA